ncbi:SoxR reducing system RseC family protein [Clostridium sp. D2Q-14]|uniref:SoxR reducing system RseC family protein n=1 Tax=Anaeromonas gelatinilytica TaxID=2683194 RepID=UPI00193B9E45|nr:SoxR reducing system RseC family protein [Anaeromonas gelatinilytica]MBS4534226.1 SoxR reducing system RseC family protein [Anaeromonas gelatinilytica]
MDQIGYVVNIKDEIAVVDIRRTSACGEKCSSCGGGCNVPAMRVNIKNTIGAKVGNFVEVEMKTKSLMKSAFIAYIVPLIMLIVGIAGGIYVFRSIGFSDYESLGFLSGLVFLVISYFILRFIDNTIKNKNSAELKIVKVL